MLPSLAYIYFAYNHNIIKHYNLNIKALVKFETALKTAEVKQDSTFFR